MERVANQVYKTQVYPDQWLIIDRQGIFITGIYGIFC